MSTKKNIAELKQLVGQVKQNLYRRIELAAAVLADMDWIAFEHGGSDLKAHDALKSEFFPDLGGYLSLGKMIQMYRHVEREEWERLHYDVSAVEVVYDMSREVDPVRKSTVKWKQVAGEREEEIKRLKEQLAQSLDANSQLREEASALRTKLHRLEGAMEELRSSHSDRRQLVGS